MTIDSSGNVHRPQGTPSGVQFASKANSAPDGALIARGEMVLCTECGSADATFRLADVPRGYRAPNEDRYCVACAAANAAEGRSIELAPVPQAEGESLTWLVEGDDHEYITVNATSEDEASDLAASVFRDRYGDDEDAGDSVYVIVVAGFRGDDTWSDELEWVPGTGASENDAYNAIDSANL